MCIRLFFFFFLSNSYTRQENKTIRMGRWGWSPGAGMQKHPQGSKHCPACKGRDPSLGWTCWKSAAIPWGRTSLRPHRSPSHQARLGLGIPQVVEAKADTTAGQGFGISPGKAAGREHRWPGQGEVQGPELLVSAASLGTLVGWWA